MLKYYNKMKIYVQQFIALRYNNYVKETNNTNFEDFAFSMFLDLVLYFLYFVYVVFAAISFYFLVTKEILTRI